MFLVEKGAERSLKEFIHLLMKDEADIQMYNAHSLYRLIGSRTLFPDLLLLSKWIHLVEPLLVLPC